MTSNEGWPDQKLYARMAKRRLIVWRLAGCLRSCMCSVASVVPGRDGLDKPRAVSTWCVSSQVLYPCVLAAVLV